VKKMLDGKRPFESREEILSRDTVALIYMVRSTPKDANTPVRTCFIEDDREVLF